MAADATEDILVTALSKRSALSEGDRLGVEIRDATYWLRVQQLKPKPHVSVIGLSLLPHDSFHDQQSVQQIFCCSSKVTARKF